VPLGTRTIATGFAFAIYLLTRGASAQAPAETTAPASDCPEQDPTLCGRRHFEVGTRAFEAGDYAGAVKEFELAIKHRAHPVIRFNLALSLSRLGKPSAAVAQLRLAVADPATDKALRERAERELRSAEQAQARVTFRLTDPSRERAELDGVEVALSAQQDLAIDPGTHQVRVISGSAVVLDQELELAPGERVELRVGERSRRIDVVVVPDPVTTKPPAPPRPPPKLSPRPRPRPLPVGWFYTGIGATAVVTGFTIWSGVDTNHALSDYERDLPELDQAEADARVAAGHRRELRTNLLLTGSVLCAAGTAVLGIWFVDFGGGARAQAVLTPRALVVSGSF
jgi:hypothetical protein